jgi:hypothetical protein
MEVILQVLTAVRILVWAFWSHVVLHVITIASEEVGTSISRKVMRVMTYMGFTPAKTAI